VLDDGNSITGFPLQIDIPADCMTEWPELGKMVFTLPSLGNAEIDDDFSGAAKEIGWSSMYQNGSEPTAANGSRGAQYTVSDIGTPSHPVMLMHVIEGLGWVDRPGKPEFHVPAGQSVAIQPTGTTALSTLWPARARALVPRTKRPPVISALALRHAAGPIATLSFRLDQPARVTVEILRGRKRVARTVLNARRGRNVLHPFRQALRSGRYTLRVTATRKHRVSTATTRFKA
jgi:hypothetical protein